METLTDQRPALPDQRLTLAAASRLIVQGSTLLSAVAGCWLLMPRPALALAVALAYIAGLIAARKSFDVALTTILLFTYTSTGLLLILGPSAASVPIWLAAVAGLVAGTSWTRWQGPRAWVIPLVIWLVGIAISWPVITARELDFSLASPRNPAGLILAIAVTNLALGLLLDTLLTWDPQRIQRRVIWPLVVSALMSGLVALYQGLFDIAFLSDVPWTTQLRAPGLMADANPMAIAAAACAPLAFVLIRPRSIALGAVACVMLWYASWLTGARSSVLLIAGGAAGLLTAWLVRRVGIKRALIVMCVMTVIGTAGVIAAVNTGLRASPTTPVGRLIRTLPLSSLDYLVYEAFWRRDGYGVAAARAIAEHPMNGVGIGAFYGVASHYHRIVADNPLPPDNAQNLWRHALVERGVLGFVAIVLFTIATLRLLLRPATERWRFTSWVVRALLVGLGGVLMFGVPTQNAAVALTAIALVAWLHGMARSNVPATELSNALVTIALAMAITGAALDAWAGVTTLRPGVRAARLGDRFAYGFGDEVIAPNGARARLVERRAAVAIPATGTFVVQVWARGTSAHAMRVWSDGHLIIDERAEPSTMIERVLQIPADRRGVLLDIWSEPPGLLVVGTPRSD